MQESIESIVIVEFPHLSFAQARRIKSVYAPILETFGSNFSTGISRPLLFISACLATSNSFSFALLTVGYARFNDAKVLITADATTILVNHLLSAGITYHGA